MMRVTTLRATPSGGVAVLLAYYAGLAADRAGEPGRGPVDYYLDPDEPPGRWWGDGRHALGLDGPVEGDDLAALLDGRDPARASVLGRGFGERSARGFDATFSAPKSVSVLWAISPDPWVRAEVAAAHDAAVQAALDWFETHGAVTRRGAQGALQVDTQGLTMALFRQHTSRSVDPQLHTHAVIAAKVQDPTGRWLALDARFLMYQQRTIGWIYDAALRAELSGRLGVTWGDLTGGQAELTAIPEDVRELYSQRTAQVEAKRDELIDRWRTEHDGAQPDAADIARMTRSAVLASRPPKVQGHSAAELRGVWQDQARAAGVSLEVLAVPLQVSQPVPPWNRTAIAGEAIARVQEEASSWHPADVARHVATLLPPQAAGSGRELTALVEEITGIALERLIPLTPNRDGPVRSDGRPVLEHVTDRHVTTRFVLEEEQHLQDWAHSRAWPIDEPITDPVPAAIEAMAGPAGLVLVVGPAGAGKTTTVATAIGQITAAGRPVIGLAPSGKAADVLRVEAGCPTATVAAFLLQHAGPDPKLWPAGTTVVLDEAGMTATTDLARLVDLVQTRHWRLVAIGDPAQLPAVGRGGVFAHWCDTVPHHELDTPHRFIEPWEAAASLELRRGDPAVARTYRDHERLHAAHPVLLPEVIAHEHHQHLAAGRSVAITTGSTATAQAINHAIQERREPDGRSVALHDGSVTYAGDTIATRQNDRSLVTSGGEVVRNRHVWHVDEVQPSGALRVSHPERGDVTLPAAYVAEHVELGWAVTGYGNQGDTVDVGLAVLEPGARRNHTYVALTRGRESNHAWVPDPTGQLDPVDKLATILEQDSDRGSALATRARLHREIGLEPPSVSLREHELIRER
jgi:conjugative relaxase-like TrwC/TraI family protein